MPQESGKVLDKEGYRLEIGRRTTKSVLERRHIVDVEGHHRIGSTCLEEARDIFGGDRVAGLRPSVLAGVAKVRDDCRYALRTSVFQRSDKEEQTAKFIVGALFAIAIQRVNHKDVLATHLDERSNLVLAIIEPAFLMRPENQLEVLRDSLAIISGAFDREQSEPGHAALHQRFLLGRRLERSPLSSAIGHHGICDSTLPGRRAIEKQRRQPQVRARPNMWEADSALLTDLYQLNMLAAYLEHGLTETAVFELLVRKLPTHRGFLMAAGLEQAMQFLETLSFTPTELDALRGLGQFPDSFFAWLRSLRFTGDVDAMPEGTMFFPDEPILRVTAPLPEAQFVETRLVNLLHFQTVVASKAAHMVLAAPGKPLIDYGLRRAHGAEAGVLAARASYIAGFSGTATVAAGIAFGVPVYGTMAHFFVQAHDDEVLAFEHFAHSHPKGLVLLIDTYDTERAAGRVVALAPRLARKGLTISGVRIDSGDLGQHAARVRRILDEGGLQSIKIVASGGLDENALLELSRADAPIDSYGVGTSLTTSSDDPALDCAYKLQEYAGTARRKRSEGKATWPGRKQVWRWYDEGGLLARDLVSLAVERYEGEPLLRPAMRGGRRLADLPDLTASRAQAKNQLARLPPALARLETYNYPVQIGVPLRELAATLDQRSG